MGYGGKGYGYTQGGYGYGATDAVRVINPYDPTEYSAWFVGNTISNGNAYSGMSGSADVRMAGFFTRLALNPGTYYITHYYGRVAFMLTACDLLEVVVCKLVGSDFEVVASADITSQKPATNTSTSMTATVDNLEFTIESGSTYFFGLFMRGTVARSSGEPGVRHSTGRSADASYTFISGAGVSSTPTTFTPTLRTSGEQVHQRLRVLTKNRIVYTITSPAVGSSPLIPIRDDGLTVFKFDGVVVNDTQNLDIRFRTSDLTNVETLTLDFVNDDIEINATTQSLTGQDGDMFDLLCVLDRAGQTSNVLYLNRTDGQGGEGSLDIATISHAAKGTATRGATYSKGGTWDHSYITFEGTGTIAKMEVGYEPVVIFGDSMATFSGRIGQYLPTAFTEDRMFWRAQISGNRLTTTGVGSHTAGYLRYKSATPGIGDLCEFRDAVFCFGMYGLNDISRIGTTEANVATVTTDYFTRVEEIVDDLVANGNQPLLIGLAPYHHVPNASTLEAQAIIDWNQRYRVFAVVNRVCWYNPWFFLVDPATISDAIPRIKSEYTSDGGTHINDVAAQPVSAEAAKIFETGFVSL